MKIRSTLFIPFFFFTVLIIGFMLSANSVNAAPPAQGFATSTPGPDGRILYTVVSGDSCLGVAFKVGITEQQLRQYNTHLDDACNLTVGQTLIIGLVPVQVAPTPGPSPTTTALALTVTPFTGTTEVCVLLFNDLNGDALRQTNELGVDGGAVSLTNLNGSYSQTLTTAATIDPATGDATRACFKDVPAGDYNVSMAVPDGYNPTMLLSYKITVKAGDRASVDFGAQSKTETTAQTTAPQPSDTRSSSLGFVGLLLLLGGIGLGYYAYRSNQPKSKLKGSPLDRR